MQLKREAKLLTVIGLTTMHQVYLVCMGEFLVCMQFNAKTNTDPDQMLYSVSSAELDQKVVKVKFGQIHLNEVFLGEFLQSLGYRFTCSYKQNQYYA